MDPDLVITVLFVCEVVLAALVFAVFVLHETQRSHAATAAAPGTQEPPEGDRLIPRAEAYRRSPWG